MKTNYLNLCRSIILGLVFICFSTQLKATTYYVEYPTDDLQLTIDTASSLDTIVFLNDFTVESPLTITKDIVIKGNNNYLNGGINASYLVEVLGGSVVLDSIYFYNMYGGCIISSTTTSLEIKNSEFQTYNAAVTGGNTYLNVNYCIFHDTPISGMNIKAFNNTFLFSSYFTYGIELLDGATYNIFNNIFYNYEYAILSGIPIDTTKVHHNNFFGSLIGETYYTQNKNFKDDPVFEGSNEPTNIKFLTAGLDSTFVGAIEPISPICAAIFYPEQSTSDYQMYSFINYSNVTLSCFWDFGDGTTSTENQPAAHVYNIDGDYTVTLAVMNANNGCTDTLRYPIFVYPPVVANFDTTVDEKNSRVYLKNTSQAGDSATYFWIIYNEYYEIIEFLEKDSFFTYTDPGEYFIEFYITDSHSIDSMSMSLLLGGGVKASFTYEMVNDSTVTFYSNSTGDNLKYHWDFGDGTYADTGAVINEKAYKFDNSTKRVCLIVENDKNYTDEYCEDIWIGGSFCDLKASFDIERKVGSNTITLNNTSTGSFTDVFIDFGDDTYSETIMDRKIEHPYEEGYYYIKLTISNNYCYSEDIQKVQVGNPPCHADFSYIVNNAAQTIDLKSTSAGEGVYWLFDDGDYSFDNVLTKSFDYPGLHTIGLFAWSGDACVDYIEKDIQVGEVECSAMFTYTIDNSSNTVKCYNQAKGDNIQFEWYYSDGYYSYDANPSYQFQYPGFYTIGLYAYNLDTWCIDYYETVVKVGDNINDCEAAFTYKVDNDNLQVDFFDASKGNPLSYVWDFGLDYDTISTEKNPSIIYNKRGIYNVCLNIVNDKGIPNITCKEISVGSTATSKNCNAKFLFSKKGNTVYFTDKSIGKPINYNWNFGETDDFVSTTNPDINYTYNNNDYYLVQLDITTEDGCQSTAYDVVNINMKEDTLVARFGYKALDYSKKAGGYPVDFVGAGEGDQARLRWDFGDSTENTTTTSPTHKYDEAGTYNVCVTYADPVTGDSTTYCQDVTTTSTYIGYADAVDNLKVYPNPVNENMTIKYSIRNAGDVEFSICDLAGRKVLLLGNEYQYSGDYTKDFNLKGLSSGGYMLRISTKDGIQKHAIIKK